MNLEILVAATNEIIGLARPTPGNLWKASIVGCRALEVMADDKEFFEQLHAAVNASAALSEDMKKVFDDLSRFDDFLRVEARCLIDAGLEPAQVKRLLQEAREVRHLTRDGSIDPGAIKVGLSKLRNETCNMAEQLGRIVAAQEQSGVTRERLRKVAMGVGGITIVGVNAAAAGTLGQVYAATSILLGGKLIEKAVIGGK
jgi:hypothetical protein